MMIKKYILTGILGVGLLMGATSCGEDFLQRDALDLRQSDTFYKNETEAMEALVATYSVLQWQYVTNYGPLELILDIASGDTRKGGGSAGDQPHMEEFEPQNVVQPTNVALEVWWDKYYTGIQRANQYLERIDGVEADETFKTRTIGEVKFLRAYYYFDLVRLFGNIPLITKTLGLDEMDQTQADPKDVYNQIATDLVESIPALPQAVSDSEMGRVTSYAAKALLAKAYMHANGVYGVNLTTANGEVIDNGRALQELRDIISSGAYALLDDYSNLFRMDYQNSSESLFSIQFSDLAEWGDWGYGVGTQGNFLVTMQGIRGHNSDERVEGWGFNLPTEELFNTFEPGDLRQQASIVVAADLEESYDESYQQTGYYTNKYTGRPENRLDDSRGGDFNLNFRLNTQTIRYSDVLLMESELSGDATNLNKVRERAGLPAVGYSQAAIEHERRVELALEGQRYFDLIRWGKGPRSKDLFPIPQNEINLGGGTLVQNP
ncbi:RagB/SusD family nutrient uptake outer membrane protein [Xanthovirga aplysinae]|uniref:RagB/SusD family nutrient uptake outer membrane protein n=1 Tax=Xanthovirga aplysinae TaxID=2529853 RepID=UPI0012BB5737|nr:RagB/SusD family nutrient uptake outer membrane protein [Xanthovirga aplysinae]MTI31778.1 RagB/SusD family nutrient uptake outer membrane protein [Xanthovirga aplysinae]